MGRKIACVGEAMVELSLDAEGQTAQIGFAGDTLNTAVYLERAGAKAHKVAFVSQVGRDSFSDRMIAFIEGEGVSTAGIVRDDERLPGLYAISTDAHGERSFSYWRENSAARLLFCSDHGADFSSLDEFDVVYLSAITLAILQPDVRTALMGWLQVFRERGGLFAFDSNYRPRLWESVEAARDAVSRAWSLCDIGMPSVDDEMALFGDADPMAALARLSASGIVTGALKRGAEGPVPINAPADPSIRFSPATSVVDTTAAGDSFNGAFLAALLSGRPLGEAMLAGHDCAARVIGVRGAIIPRELS
ncbi:sugar kinase [Hoeflea prorocentri]|uniref:Sugar kinase n=1 Tax=Hoeflea prorocentri TaxID=1922333 RepID=A0A9X3ZIM0_9HYPH|nr:sugar kinase [Hoeflea prorocentri]MCY6381976.1 sugar kinase [Hoeflea prorocentri]MDA5399776.1 sugar kinase [Hoeflea prorocentri]